MRPPPQPGRSVSARRSSTACGPKAGRIGALDAVARHLEPGALLFWGQYGGTDTEGPAPHDDYEPKRYFSWLSDDAIQRLVTEPLTL